MSHLRAFIDVLAHDLVTDRLSRTPRRTRHAIAAVWTIAALLNAVIAATYLVDGDLGAAVFGFVLALLCLAFGVGGHLVLRPYADALLAHRLSHLPDGWADFLTGRGDLPVPPVAVPLAKLPPAPLPLTVTHVYTRDGMASSASIALRHLTINEDEDGRVRIEGTTAANGPATFLLAGERADDGPVFNLAGDAVPPFTRPQSFGLA